MRYKHVTQHGQWLCSELFGHPCYVLVQCKLVFKNLFLLTKAQMKHHFKMISTFPEVEHLLVLQNC